MLIMCFDFIPCCLSEVAHRVMIGYSLRCLKVIANKGLLTPNKGRVYLWPFVRIITRESLAIVEMPFSVSKHTCVHQNRFFVESFWFLIPMFFKGSK